MRSIRFVRLGLSIAMFFLSVGCANEAANEGKDYSVDRNGNPVRRPDLIANLKPAITEEESLALSKEAGEIVHPQRSIMSRPRQVFEIWFAQNTPEDNKEKLRKFLKSSPLVEGIFEET